MSAESGYQVVIAIVKKPTYPGMTNNSACDDIVVHLKSWLRVTGNLFRPEILFDCRHVGNERGFRYVYSIKIINHQTYGHFETELLPELCRIYNRLVAEACADKKSIESPYGKFANDLSLIEGVRGETLTNEEKKLLSSLARKIVKNLKKIQMRAEFLLGAPDPNHHRSIEEDLTVPSNDLFSAAGINPTLFPTVNSIKQDMPEQNDNKHFDRSCQPFKIKCNPVKISLMAGSPSSFANCGSSINVIISGRKHREIVKRLEGVFDESMNINRVVKDGKQLYVMVDD